MRITFDTLYLDCVCIPAVELEGPLTFREALIQLFSRFPQLYVMFSERPEVAQRTLIVLNDQELLDYSDKGLILQDEDELHLLEVPSGNYAAAGEAIAVWAAEAGASMVVASAIEVAITAMLPIIVNLAVQMALSAVMGALVEDVAPPDAGMGVANSATYTFDGVKNTSYSGAPVMVVYGTHRVGGNILNVYTTTEYETGASGNVSANYAHIQIGVCEGEVDSLSSIQINKMPQSFYNGVDTPQVRLGTADQTVMTDYSKVENTTSVGRQILAMKDTNSKQSDWSSQSYDYLFTSSAVSSGVAYGIVERATDGTFKTIPGYFAVPRYWAMPAETWVT